MRQWKYGEDKGEEEVEERRKIEREGKKKRPVPLQSCSASTTACRCMRPLYIEVLIIKHGSMLFPDKSAIAFFN